MSEQESQDIPYDKGVPPDAPDEEELELIDEEDEALEADTSEEATAEAGMSQGGAELEPADDIEFEEDESGVAL